MRPICLLILLIITALVTGCQPASALPTTITSNDIVGQISLQYPESWTSVTGTGNVDGRIGVTLVRSESAPQEDLSLYPVLRISYNNRQMTVLVLNTPLEEYAVRVAEEIAPGVTFEPPQVIQLAARPAVQLEGTGDDGRGVVLTVIDYAAENAVVNMLLSQPGQISDRDQAILTEIAQTISVRISPPITPTILPEATAEIPPESTRESTPAPESTAEVILTEETAVTEDAAVAGTEEADSGEAAGRSATQEIQPTEDTTPEVVPESTAETTPVDLTAEAPARTEEANADEPAVVAATTAEIERTEEAADGINRAETEITAESTPLPETTVEPTPDMTQTALAQATSIAARTVRLARNLVVVAPEGWKAVSNNHSYVVLNYGEEIADAILRENPLPTGQALIVIDVGTAVEMFPLGSPPDLPGRVKFRLENLTKYVDAATFGEIRTTSVHNKTAVETLVTTTLDDQYVILVDIGANVFIQIKLLTASGEISDFSPVAYEVAQSVVPR